MTNETKFTKEMLEVVRKATILACHEGNSYKKALEEELGFGCNIVNIYGIKYTITCRYVDIYRWGTEDGERIKGYEIKEILGLPLTFSRIMVMLAIAPAHFKQEIYTDGVMIKFEKVDGWKIYWQLINSNGSDRNFDDQTEETKLAIYEIAQEYIKTLEK